MLPLATATLSPLISTRAQPARACHEVLAKQPAGTGDHWWIQVEKDGLGTQPARVAIAKAVNAPVDAVACAGWRDRRGISVQWFSLPADVVEHPGPLKRAGTQGKMRVLAVTQSHKPVSEAVVARLAWTLTFTKAKEHDGYVRGRAIVDRLRHVGVPAYLSTDQRRRDAAKWGRLVLERKRLPPAVAALGVSPGECLGALRDSLFNRWLAARVADGLLDAVLLGDRLSARDGSELLATDLESMRKRVASWEAVVLGPLYGGGMSPAANEALAREAAVLTTAGLSDVSALQGGRRVCRAQPAKASVDVDGNNIVVRCELPTEFNIDALIAELGATRTDAQTAAQTAANEPPDAEDFSTDAGDDEDVGDG